MFELTDIKLVLWIVVFIWFNIYVNSFFPRTAKLWNSLPIECFPLTYDLISFKYRINRYLLTIGSF